MLLETRTIKKSFGGVHALKGVSISLKEGQVLGLLGENGAGKSTLMKVVSGVYPHGQYEGEVLFAGQEARLRGTRDAEALGIAIIHQELNLFPELTVAENIYLSHMPTRGGIIDYQAMSEGAQVLLDRLGVDFSPDVKVGDLTTGNQQMVEIAKAISKDLKVLILDEPTSSLSQKEIERLFRVVRDFQAQGVGLIYISHKLDEVDQLCDSVAVLRDGASVHQGPLEKLSRGQLIAYMVGREMSNLYPPKGAPKGEVVLELKNWSAYKISEGRHRVRDFSFSARSGEIVGVAGLMGAGRTDLFLSLFGHSNYRSQGELRIRGQRVSIRSPFDAIQSRVGLVTEDRKKNGLHLEFSIAENMALAALPSFTSWGVVDEERLAPRIQELVHKLHIKMGGPEHAVKTLSGGNQQKVAIAKWLLTGPQVLFLDEPTRGVDVGAKFEIYSLLAKLADEGLAVVVASSELPEVVGLCQRVLVMREGRLAGELSGTEVEEKKIMALAFGQTL